MQTRLSSLPRDIREQLAEAHTEMCRALSAEMRAQERPPIALPAGTRLQVAAGAFGAIYQFPIARPRALDEGEPITLVLPFEHGRPQLACRAVILPGRPDELLLSPRMDLGPNVDAGTSLIPRESLPLHVIQELLDSVRGGYRSFHPDIALRLLGQHDRATRLFREPRHGVSDVPASFARLWPGDRPDEPNESQQAAILSMTHRSLSATLGPPGTGKTSTIVAGVEWLLRGHDGHANPRPLRPRILIVAPSNAAVDEVLGRVVDRLARRGRVRPGAVLRVGRNVTSEFVERHGDVASPGAVAEKVRSERLQRAVRTAVRIETVLDETNDLRLLESILPPDQHEERLAILGRLRRLARLARRLEDVHRLRARAFEKALRRPGTIPDELLETCQVLGTTAHTALMQPAIREGRWDVIIIDECGALPLVLCYALAILARERVWFHGDPRQLPPVVLSDSRLANRWLRRDAFSASGGYEDDEDGRLHLHEHVVRIGPNRRMHPEIASLIADAYGGDLKTDPGVARARRSLPALPFAHPSRKTHGVYLADTSDLTPRAQFAHGGSRINRVHLAAVRGIVTLLHEHGLVGPGRGSLAVITPYLAQARRHGDMLSRFFPRTVARAGSAHTWQGQEADVVVLDLVEGRGIPVYEWMRASRWSEEGSRLMLVSLSRARGRLIVLADVAGLRVQLEPLHHRPILLSLLDRMEGCGAIDVATQVRGRTEELRQLRHESREVVAAD